MATYNTSSSGQNGDEDHTIDDKDDLPEVKCDVCGLVFDAVSSYEIHIKGKKHNSKLRAKQTKKKVSSSSQPSKEVGTGDEDISELIYCAICKLHCSGITPYRQHTMSSKHLKQLKKDKLNEHLQNTPEVLAGKKKNSPGEADSGEFLGLPKSYGKCDICSKTFYAPESLKQHMESPAHLKKVTQASMKTRLQSNIVDQKDADVVINDESAPSADGNITKVYAECRTCGKKFTGPESFQMHLVSNGHQKRIELQKLEEKMKGQGEGPGVVADGKYLCKECDKTFANCMGLKQHLENNIHAKMNTKKDIADFLNKYPEIIKVSPTADDDAAPGEEEEESLAQEMDDFYVCRFCKSSFTGPESAKQHVMGKKHKRVKEIMKRLDAADASEEAAADASDEAAATLASEQKVSSTSDVPDQDTDDDNTDGFEIIHE